MATANRSAKLDLGDYLPYLVNRVGSIVAEQFGEEALAPYGLSIAMWRVLAALASAGEQRQIDLADLTSIDSSTLSRLVTRLIRVGLVTRTRLRVGLVTRSNQQPRGCREVVSQGQHDRRRTYPDRTRLRNGGHRRSFAGRINGPQALPASDVQQYEVATGRAAGTPTETRGGLTSGAFPHRRPDRSPSPGQPHVRFWGETEVDQQIKQPEAVEK
jgi:hypothetical protein